MSVYSDIFPAYNILLLPYSITKLLEVSGYPVAFGGNVFANTCSFMLGLLHLAAPSLFTHDHLGLVNVCILYNTFRVLRPAFIALSNVPYGSGMDMESNGGALKKTISPLPVAQVIPSQSPEKSVPYRASGDSLLPCWQVSESNITASPWTRTLTLQNSTSSLDADSPKDYDIPGYSVNGHSDSPGLGLSIIARPIVPFSELDNPIAKPEPVFRNMHLQHNHRRSSLTHSLQPPTNLPPPPRRKHSVVSHHCRNEVASPPCKDQFQGVDSRQESAISALPLGPPLRSVTSWQRGSFGIPCVSLSPREQQGSSCRPSQLTADFSNYMMSSISDFRMTLSDVASNDMPPSSIALPSFTDHIIDNSETPGILPVAPSRIMPRKVDNNDPGPALGSVRRTSDIPRKDIHSSESAAPFTPVGLSPSARAE